MIVRPEIGSKLCGRKCGETSGGAGSFLQCGHHTTHTPYTRHLLEAVESGREEDGNEENVGNTKVGE